MKIVKILLLLATVLCISCDSNEDTQNEPTVEYKNDLFESKTCQEETITIQPIVVNWNGVQGAITITDSLNDPDLQVNQQNGAISYTKELYFGDHYITIKIESNDGSYVRTESFLLKKDISGTLAGKEGTVTQVENNQGQNVSIEFILQGSDKIAKKYINNELVKEGTFSYNQKEVIIELSGNGEKIRVVGNAMCESTPYFDAKTFTYPLAQGATPHSTPKPDGYLRLYPND